MRALPLLAMVMLVTLTALLRSVTTVVREDDAASAPAPEPPTLDPPSSAGFVVSPLMASGTSPPPPVEATSPPSSATPAPAAANASRRPNVLFLFADSWRFDFDGLHPGLPLRLPHFRAVAAAGVRFRHAFTPSPQCTPARAALISGREYDDTGVPDNAHSYPLSKPTFYSQLKKAGYQVLTAGKDDLSQLNAGWARHEEANARALGFTNWSRCFGKMDTVRVHGHAPLESYGKHLDRKGLWRRHKGDFAHRINDKEYFNFAPTFLEENDYQDNWIGGVALDMLREASHSQPWFLQVNFAGPHPPLDVTAAMRASVERLNLSLAANSSIDAQQQRWMRRLYAAQVENLDRWTGRYVHLLRDTGQLGHTLVCISSDHGEMLGDHTMLGKECPFRGGAAVPLACRGPGVAAGVVVDSPVTVLDLAATFLHYGAANPMPGMAAMSLDDVLAGRAIVPRRKYVLSGFGYFRTITHAPLAPAGAVAAVYRLLCCRGPCHRPYHSLHWKRPTLPSPSDPPTVLLFDVAADPLEQRDLAAALPAVAAALARELRRRTAWDCFAPARA